MQFFCKKVIFLCFSGRFFGLRGGHKGVAQALFGAGAHTLHAAYAVGVAYKIRVGNINVHGAFAGALSAATASLCVAPNTENAQHAQQAHAGTTCAQVVTERAVRKQGQHHHAHHKNTTGCVKSAPEQGAEVVRPFKQLKADGIGKQQKIEDIAGQLQILLQALRHPQTR